MSADELRRAAAEYDTWLDLIATVDDTAAARDRVAALSKEVLRLRNVVETEQGHFKKLQAKTTAERELLERERASKARALSMAFRSSRAGAQAAADEAAGYNRAVSAEEACGTRLAALEAEHEAGRAELAGLAAASTRHTSAIRELGMLYARVFDNHEGIPSGAAGVANKTLDDVDKARQAADYIREAADVLRSAITPLKKAEQTIGHVIGTERTSERFPTSAGTYMPRTRATETWGVTRLGNRRFQLVMADAQRAADRAKRLTEQAAQLNPTLWVTGTRVDPFPDEDSEYPIQASDYLHVRRIRAALDALRSEESRVRVELGARAGREADRLAGERGRAVRQMQRERDSLEDRRREIMRAAGAGAGAAPAAPRDTKMADPADVLASDGAEAPPPAYTP